MRILITGSNGLLGQKLVAALGMDPLVDLMATSRGADRTPDRVREATSYRYGSMDITVPEEIARVFDKFRPEVVIHTAALTNVDACELDPEACWLQNVTATGYLVEASLRHDAHFILLSTDFVFDGKDGPYREEDPPSPLSHYGRSKWESEKLVMGSGLRKWAIARTIIVYGVAKGLTRTNVVLWARKALMNAEPIRVVDDQWRMPTLAEDLADGCIRIADRGATGIYHLSGPEGMTILELVERVGRYFGLDTSVITPIKSNSLGQPAARPPRTGFILDKARRELGYAPRDLNAGLEVIRTQLEKEAGGTV